jgi:WD40 repeat protein
MRRALRALVLAAAALLLGACASTAPAGCAPVNSGDLYYTRYSGSPNVKKVHYTYRGGTLTFGVPVAVADLRGVDGVAFAPDGDLLVGSAGDVVHKVHISNGSTKDLTTGGGPAYHVTVDPSGKKAWIAGIPGVLTELPLSPAGKGTTHQLKGDDTAVTTIAFDASGNAYYTSSGADGHGDFGQINLKTFTTKRAIEGRDGLHGMAFDTYTGDLITFGGEQLLQIDPKTRKIVSALTVKGGVRLDQGTVNGHGYIYVASNNGQLVFVDYGRTKKVGDAKTPVIVTALDSGLDDVAPESGPGAQPCKS